MSIKHNAVAPAVELVQPGESVLNDARAVRVTTPIRATRSTSNEGPTRSTALLLAESQLAASSSSDAPNPNPVTGSHGKAQLAPIAGKVEEEDGTVGDLPSPSMVSRRERLMSNESFTHNPRRLTYGTGAGENFSLCVRACVRVQGTALFSFCLVPVLITGFLTHT